MNSKIITSANNKGTGQHPYSLIITSSLDSRISNAKLQASEWLLDGQSVFFYLVSDPDNSFSFDEVDVPLTLAGSNSVEMNGN